MQWEGALQSAVKLEMHNAANPMHKQASASQFADTMCSSIKLLLHTGGVLNMCTTTALFPSH